MEIQKRSGRNVFGFSLLLVFLFSFAVSGVAQSSIITTYVGPPLPVDGAKAITQAVDQPSSVVLEGAGGFYVASASQNRVYRVAVDGTLAPIAGSSSNGFSGDSGPATSAQLNSPRAVALDTTGNLYITDSGNNRIRKVTADGVITTVAGNGKVDFSGNGGSAIGDGGPATSAQLRVPMGIAVDAAGNLYIADALNSRIRKVTADGMITTVAGNGTFGFSGDGGAGISAQLRVPTGVAVDTVGNLYIADTNNSRIRKVTPGGVISTVAGTDTHCVCFSGDAVGIAVNGAGELYIVDSYRVRKMTASGVISIVAGNGISGFSGDGGPATSAQLNLQSGGVAVDLSGNLYIADSNNSRVRKVTADGTIRTIAGSGTSGFGGDGGPGSFAQLNRPSGVAVDTVGNLYIADTDRVRKVTPGGVINTFAGDGTFGFSGDGGPATSAQIDHPSGIAVDAAGNLYIADTNNYRVRKVSADGVISTVAGNGISGFTGDGGPAISAQINRPGGVAVDPAGNMYFADGGNTLYSADSGNNRVRKVSADGVISTIAGNGTFGFSGDGGPATSAQLFLPSGVAVDTVGNLYIADTYNFRVRKVNADGVISTVEGNDTSAEGFGPRAIAVDAGGNLYIASWSWNSDSISKVTPGGVISTVAGNGISGFSGDGGPATSGQINRPVGIAVDAAGNLYIADTLNSRVRRVGNAGDLPLVTDIQFDPFTVSVQSSWTATFSGRNLTDQTYFDVRFQQPGSETPQVALNWQRGTSASHSVLNATDVGTWIVTGVRPHQDVSDHTAGFLSVSEILVVTHMAF